MLTLITLERLAIQHLHFTPFNPECKAFDQRLSRLAPGALDDSPERLTRYVHTRRGILLIEPFKIGQPNRLELIHRQDDLL
jgi:hypothetical protein